MQAQLPVGLVPRALQREHIRNSRHEEARALAQPSPESDNPTPHLAPVRDGVREELEQYKEKLLTLQQARAAKAAEIASLQEALADARSRTQEAETKGNELALDATGRGERRALVVESITGCDKRIVELRARCVELQTKTPLPADVTNVHPDVQPLVGRALSLDQELQDCRARLRQREQDKSVLEHERIMDAQEMKLLGEQITVLDDVYEETDRRLQEIHQNGSGEVNSSTVVLALARIVLPLVEFADANDALAQLQMIAKTLRPHMMPQAGGPLVRPSWAPSREKMQNTTLPSWANMPEVPALVASRSASPIAIKDRSRVMELPKKV